MNIRKFNWPIWAGFLLSLGVSQLLPCVRLVPCHSRHSLGQLTPLRISGGASVGGSSAVACTGPAQAIEDRCRNPRHSQRRDFRILYLRHFYYGEALARLP